MTRSDINKVNQASQDAINAMRNARSATVEFQQAILNHAALDELKLLADKAAAAHADAVSDSRKLETCLKSAAVADAESAMTSAMDKVQTAAAFAQQLKTEASQAASTAAAAAAGAIVPAAPAVIPPALTRAAPTTKLADDDAVARLQDVEAAFKYSDEYQRAKATWLDISWAAVGKWLGGVVLVLIAFVLLSEIRKAFSGDGELLENLARIDYARGVITFLLSLGTIVIAVLLVLGMLLSDGQEESERKFSRAKEVLTVLVGIFGTILGFYFGTTSSSQGMLALGLSPLAIARSADGSATTIAGTISGGKPPYTYGIAFKNDEMPAIKNQTSKDGLLTVTMTNAPAGKSVGYTITISDSGTNRVEYPAREEQFIKGK